VAFVVVVVIVVLPAELLVAIDARVESPARSAVLPPGVHWGGEVDVARRDVGEAALGVHQDAVVVVAQLVPVLGSGGPADPQEATEFRVRLQARQRERHTQEVAVVPLAIGQIFGIDPLDEQVAIRGDR
jgi:hypothetical protein